MINIRSDDMSIDFDKININKYELYLIKGKI